MELALGGDLFDMVEAGRGLAPDLAHFYFRQLINGLDFLHAHGVAHRDIKPENLMLDAAANLKIGDFGLAALFRLQKQEGQRRKCTTVCGSPPYVAPEVLAATPTNGGYDPDRADIWSAGVVLYVLLLGTTPWAAAIDSDPEYCEYFPAAAAPPPSSPAPAAEQAPRSVAWDALGLPADALSMLKCLLKPGPAARVGVPEIRTHPWFLQRNPYLAYGGGGEVCSDPDGLLARVLANFHVDLTDAAHERSAPSTQIAPAPPHDTSMTSSSMSGSIATTSTTAAAGGGIGGGVGKPVFASQQLLPRDQEQLNPAERHYLRSLAQDPLLVQFRAQDSPAARELALTQLSQQYTQTQREQASLSDHQKPASKRAIMNDLLLGRVWTKFYSLTSLEALVPAVVDALFQLGATVRAARDSMAYLNQKRAAVPLRMVDRRGRVLRGVVEFVKIERFAEVSFIRTSGDNLEWRFMFKRAVVLCRHHLFLGDTAASPMIF
jgi:serine/threonine-protein kinase Chk1